MADLDCPVDGMWTEKCAVIDIARKALEERDELRKKLQNATLECLKVLKERDGWIESCRNQAAKVCDQCGSGQCEGTHMKDPYKHMIVKAHTASAEGE